MLHTSNIGCTLIPYEGEEKVRGFEECLLNASWEFKNYKLQVEKMLRSYDRWSKSKAYKFNWFYAKSKLIDDHRALASKRLHVYNERRKLVESYQIYEEKE